MPRLYEKAWNGIDLLDIARDSSLLTDGLPNERFYAEFYRRLAERGYSFSSGWLAAKHRLSERFQNWLREIGHELGKEPTRLRVLSVSAGLGVVEAPLQRAGFDITLHEVAAEALDGARRLAREQGLPEPKTLVGPVEQLPPGAFDVIHVGTCEYCISRDEDYGRFLRALKAAASPGGAVIAWDPNPVWKDYLREALTRLNLLGKPGIWWGVLRRPSFRARRFGEAGLAVRAVELYDHEWVRPIGSPLRERGYAVIHARA